MVLGGVGADFWGPWGVMGSRGGSREAPWVSFGSLLGPPWGQFLSPGYLNKRSADLERYLLCVKNRIGALLDPLGFSQEAPGSPK